MKIKRLKKSEIAKKFNLKRTTLNTYFSIINKYFGIKEISPSIRKKKLLFILNDLFKEDKKILPIGLFQDKL